MILIPIYVLIIVLIALLKKVNGFELFKEGVISSINNLKGLYSSLLAIIISVELLKASNIISILEVVSSYIKIIPELMIQALLKPISSSSSLLLMTSIYIKYGVNSKYAIQSSILQNSSDTTLYIISMYYSLLHIKLKQDSMKYTLRVCLITNILTYILIFIIF